MRRTTAVVMLAAALSAAGCASGEDGTDVTGRAAGSASSTTTEPTDAGAAGLGTPDPVETTPAGPKTFAMGYKATITEDDVEILHITVSNPRAVRGNDFSKSENGRFLAVTVTYEALAPAQDINPFDLIVTTSGGERLDPTFGPDAGVQLDSATLNTGEKAKGSVVFDVPKTGVLGIAYAPAGQVLGTWKL